MLKVKKGEKNENENEKYSVQYKISSIYTIFVWSKKGTQFSLPHRWMDITLSGRSWQEKGKGKIMEIVYLNILKIIYHGIGLRTQRDIAEQNLVSSGTLP